MIHDLSGWRIENQEVGLPAQSAILPSGTFVPQGGLLIISRDSSRAEFEAHFGGSLGDNVAFVNGQAGNSGVPIINGDERWALYDDNTVLVDGPTIEGSAATTYHRISALSAGTFSSWEHSQGNVATPGVTRLTEDDRGVFVSEWSDVTGSGVFPFEFVEIYVNP